MKAAVHVDRISKLYHLGSGPRGGYRTFRESLSNVAARAVRRLRRGFARQAVKAEQPTELWALKDVSLEVPHGEVVGIIGRNGAGKSTLLKVLSRITEPTTGRAVLHGRVGSLLEVGTGFHPELTGRENIFLNGAILGMSRQEIRAKLDDIVSFAEIGALLDTPAKRYSSGLYVRLAFAVAAFLEPEIFIVDEVLAVGDLSFQKRCLDRMRELGKRGGTVLFVSHNMGTIASLCNKAVIIDKGRAMGYGEACDQVRKYVASLNEHSTSSVGDRQDRTGNGAARIVNIAFRGSSGEPLGSVLVGEPVTIEFEYVASRPLTNVEIWVWVCNDEGKKLTCLSNRYTGHLFRAVPQRGTLSCTIPEVSLCPGTYLLDFTLVDGLDVADLVPAAAQLVIEPGPFYPTGRIPTRDYAVTLTRHAWALRSPEPG